MKHQETIPIIKSHSVCYTKLMGVQWDVVSCLLDYFPSSWTGVGPQPKNKSTNLEI